MTDREILKKAIEKAQSNGFTLTFGIQGQFEDSINIDRSYCYGIIFSHKFLMALFGTDQDWICLSCDCTLDSESVTFDERCAICGSKTTTMQFWEYQAIKMVRYQNPLEFLESFLD